MLRLWGREMDGEILSEINESIREEVLDALPKHVLAEAVRELESDDVVDLIEDLEEAQQEEILDALEESDRAAVEQSLAYPEYSAGRLMQREVVSAPEFWSVGQTIDFLRAEPWLPDQFYHVILVDPGHHPIGYVTLGKLLAAKRETLLKDLSEDSFRTISAFQEEGDVAYAFNQYHLISAPVVDDDDRLVGVITIDDAMAVLDEEHEEDMLLLAGVGEESSVSDGGVRDGQIAHTLAVGEPRFGQPVGLGDLVVLRFHYRNCRAGGFDADCRLDGRECGHAILGSGRARARHAQPDRKQRAPRGDARGGGGADQRRVLRADYGRGRLSGV